MMCNFEDQMDGAFSTHGEMINAYKILDVMNEGRRLIKIHRRR
jgi:hypothetical protein